MPGRANPFATATDSPKKVSVKTKKADGENELKTKNKSKREVKVVKKPTVISANRLKDKTSYIQEIKIDRIKSPIWHDRKIYDTKEIESLASNIQASSLLQPILVREIKNDPIYQYERIAGFRRIEAFLILKRDCIPAVVLPSTTTDSDSILMMLSENIQRVDINPFDQTLGILEYLARTENTTVDEVKKLLYKIRNNDTGQTKENESLIEAKERMETVTMELGKITISSLINRMSMFKFPESIIQAIKTDGLSIALANELNRIKDEDEIQRILKLLKDGEITRKEIRNIADTLKSNANNTNDDSMNRDTSKPITSTIKVKNNKDGSVAIRIDKNFPPSQRDKLRSLLKEFGIDIQL